MSKTKYIKAWEEHIKQLWTLAFCSDLELSDKVKGHIDCLTKLVKPIADTKTSWSK